MHPGSGLVVGEEEMMVCWWTVLMVPLLEAQGYTILVSSEIH